MRFLISFIVLMLISGTSVAHKEAVWERVEKTNTIRCGYVVVAPAFFKDPNTGELSGLIYDLVEKVGDTLKYNIEWTEERTFGDIVQGLYDDRYDMICSSLYARTNIARSVEMTRPYYYVPINAYKKKGKATPKNLNTPNIKIAYKEGAISHLIKQTVYPNSGSYLLPQSLNYSDQLEAVAMGNADIVFAEPSVAATFMKNGGGKLEKVKKVSPLRVYPNVFGVRKGEHSLTNTLNVAIQYLISNGEVYDIIKKYQVAPYSYLRVKEVYEAQ